MPDLTKIPSWFLGANAPKGYYSKFDQLFRPFSGGKLFLLKGGPGTGKSTFLKKFAGILAEKGLEPELVFCSADPKSLDAVMTSDGKFAAADATLPHPSEPKYPGAYETVISLSDFWDEEKLFEHRKEIIALSDANRKLHEEARRYISSAASLLDEAARLGMDSVLQEKTEKAAIRLCSKEFGRKRMQKGSEKQRFLSAITEEGVFFFNETPKILCERIYLLDDDVGAVTRIFMNAIRKNAVENGLDIITCRCPVFPSEKIEHIFIPSLKIGFMTVNRRHKIKIAPYRTIHWGRFTDRKKYAINKIRIRFALRYAKKLIDEAASCIKEAKKVHDKLESYYIDAMDFSLVEEKFKAAVKSIF